VDRLRRALRDNPLPRSPERDRLDALAGELDRLDREELEPAGPLLSQALAFVAMALLMLGGAARQARRPLHTPGSTGPRPA
jgi:hypothetical protein